MILYLMDMQKSNAIISHIFNYESTKVLLIVHNCNNQHANILHIETIDELDMFPKLNIFTEKTDLVKILISYMLKPNDSFNIFSRKTSEIKQRIAICLHTLSLNSHEKLDITTDSDIVELYVQYSNITDKEIINNIKLEIWREHARDANALLGIEQLCESISTIGSILGVAYKNFCGDTLKEKLFNNEVSNNIFMDGFTNDIIYDDEKLLLKIKTYKSQQVNEVDYCKYYIIFNDKENKIVFEDIGTVTNNIVTKNIIATIKNIVDDSNKNNIKDKIYPLLKCLLLF